MSLSNRANEYKFNFDYNNYLCRRPNNNTSNEYLFLFGYLPRYFQIQKLVNKKFVNLMKKIIKQKIFKFYSKNNNSSFNIEDAIATRLKWIKAKQGHKLTNDKMLEFIKYHPIKYFMIDFPNSSFDYLFSLIEIIIDEIIDSKELKDSSQEFLNEAQREWYFKHLFFNSIKNKNVFLDFYIENTIVIKTIFKNKKIENFEEKENSINILKQFNYNYCFYNQKKDILETDKNFKLKEIRYEPDDFIEENEEEKDNLGYFFVKKTHFEKITEGDIEYKPGYYYVEKGMDLLTFLEETCNEYDELINEIYKDNKYKNYLLKKFNKEYYMNEFNLNNKDYIVIALNENDLLFGKSIESKEKNNIKYKWVKWSNEIFKHEAKKLNENEVKNLYRIQGFFIFEKK